MADLGEENKVSGVFGGVEFGNNNNEEQNQNINTNRDVENFENAGNNKKRKFTSKTWLLE